MDADDEMILEPGDYEMIDALSGLSSSSQFTDENLFDFDKESICSESTLLLFEEMNLEEELEEFQPPDRSQDGDRHIDPSVPEETMSKLATCDYEASATNVSRVMVITEIESLLEKQVDVLLDQSDSMSLSLRTLRKFKPEDVNGAIQTSTQTYRFPGNSASEAWRFTVIFRLLIMIHDALATNTVLTKRDLYYRDPNLFRSQNTVDRYVDHIARTFDVPRSLLNVTSAAKGLAAGPFILEKLDGSIITGNEHNEGFLISSMASVTRVNTSSINWILVVEKEATFRSLLESPFWINAKSSGVLVTAKGYPDLLTREFLSLISTPSERNQHSSLPVHGLFDFDPYGVGIFHTYKHGSLKMAHEPCSHGCTHMQWLGLNSSDVFFTNEQSRRGLIQLTRLDRRRASKMLSWPAFSENSPEKFLRWEIQVMLFMNKKAEIQLLEAFPGGLSTRLTQMLVTPNPLK